MGKRGKTPNPLAPDDRGLSSNTSGSAGHTKQRLTRLTPGQRTEKAIARGLLFRNVTPRLRFGTENALGTALGFLLSDDDCLTTTSVQGKSPHHGSGAVIILRDSSRDTAFGQLAADGETQQKTSHMNMTKMATATDPLPRPEKVLPTPERKIPPGALIRFPQVG